MAGSRRSTTADPHPDLADPVSVSRFWGLVERAGDADCWKWLGDTDRNGYGIFVWHGRRRPAHELALSFTTGEVRHPSLDTCHECDVADCCNPSHLRFDTRKSNVADMYLRGRENNMKRLSDEDIRLIRERRSLGARQKDLAQQFGCGDGYISTIVRGLARPEAGGPIENQRSQIWRTRPSLL